MALGSDRDHEIGGLAQIPAGSKPGFIGEAERHAVVIGEDLESPLADGFEKQLVEKQSVRVGPPG